MLVIHKTFMICCIQPATPGYCSFLSITNIQGSNYLLTEYKIGLEMLAKKIKMMYVYTYIFFSSQSFICNNMLRVQAQYCNQTVKIYALLKAKGSSKLIFFYLSKLSTWPSECNCD